jgi:(p)ppGpp synthase/HD superfamily hydrolase
MLNKKMSERVSERENKAWELAREVHRDQKRESSGRPYIAHIEEVVKILHELQHPVVSEDVVLSAILHDVIENCEQGQITALVKRIVEDFGANVLSNVLALSKDDGKSYQEYIDTLTHTHIASSVLIVKIADMIQNLTETPTAKQREKYRKALPKLIAAYSNLMGE